MTSGQDDDIDPGKIVHKSHVFSVTHEDLRHGKTAHREGILEASDRTAVSLGIVRRRSDKEDFRRLFPERLNQIELAISLFESGRDIQPVDLLGPSEVTCQYYSFHNSFILRSVIENDECSMFLGMLYRLP